MHFNIFIGIFIAVLIKHSITDDPERELTKCEICKFLGIELTANLFDHNSTQKMPTSYRLDDLEDVTVDYRTSEVRFTEVVDSVCARILEYNVHAERSGSNRYAKGKSETMQSLWGLRNRGVKVILDVPEDMWDHPSAEITNLEKACNLMVEEYEDDIKNWYYGNQSEPLRKYLCEDRVLLHTNQSCLDEVYVPPAKEEEKSGENSSVDESNESDEISETENEKHNEL